MNRHLLLASLIFGCIAGCGDIPAATMPDIPTSESWLDDSRGGCNWDAAGGIFSVDAPSRWTYFGEVDRALVTRNLKRPDYVPPDNPLAPSEVPGELDSFEYVRLRERTPQKASPVASFPIANDVRHCQMTSNGNYILVVGSEVAILNIEGEPKSQNVKLPTSDFQAIYLANDGRTLTLVLKDSVLKIDSSTGNVLREWRPVASDVLASDFARHTGYVLVGQSDRRVVLLDENLIEKKSAFPNRDETQRLALGEIKTVATNETGSVSTVVFEGACFHCTLTEDEPWAQDLQGMGQQRDLEVGAGVRNTAFWNGKVLIDDRTISEPNRSHGDYEFLMHVENVDLSIAHLLSRFQWALMLNRVYLNGSWQYALQDSGMHYWGRSAPISLGTEKPIGFSGDLSHEFVAIRYPGRIDLIKRRRWSNTTLKCHLDNLLSGLNSDDPMPIIRTYEAIGETEGLLPVGLTGEELLAWSSDLIGFWLYESQFQAQGAADKVQEWLSSGSRLALASQCAGEMYRRRHWYFDEYSAGHFDRMADQLKRESPDSLLAILSEARLLAHDVIANQERLSQLAKRAVEGYPNNAMIHKLMNRGDAVEGMQLAAVNAYLAELVQCYPEDQRDRIYAEFGLQLCALLRTGFTTAQGSLNAKRLSAGFQEIAQQRTLNLDSVTKILNFAFESNDEALAKCIGEHQLAHHPLFPVYGFDPQIYEIAIEHYRSLGRRDGE